MGTLLGPPASEAHPAERVCDFLYMPRTYTHIQTHLSIHTHAGHIGHRNVDATLLHVYVCVEVYAPVGKSVLSMFNKTCAK